VAILLTTSLASVQFSLPVTPIRLAWMGNPPNERFVNFFFFFFWGNIRYGFLGMDQDYGQPRTEETVINIETLTGLWRFSPFIQQSLTSPSLPPGLQTAMARPSPLLVVATVRSEGRGSRLHTNTHPCSL
jgi:hypothetical protein